MALANALPVASGEPIEGRRAFPMTLDFSIGQNLSFNQIPQSIGMPSGVQGIYIDNSNNASQMILTLTGTGQKIVMPAYSQGSIPLFAVNKSNVNFSATSLGGVAVGIQLLNYQPEYTIIQVGTASGATIVQGTVTARPPQIGLTNRSSQIAAANTAVLVMGANGNRKAHHIQNPATPTGQSIANVEPLYVNFGAAANVENGDAVELLPGGSIDLIGGGVSTQDIWANAATANHKFIAYEG